MIAKIVISAWMIGCAGIVLVFVDVAGRYLGEAEAARDKSPRRLAMLSAALSIALALLFSLIAGLLARAI